MFGRSFFCLTRPAPRSAQISVRQSVSRHRRFRQPQQHYVQRQPRVHVGSDPACGLYQVMQRFLRSARRGTGRLLQQLRLAIQVENFVAQRVLNQQHIAPPGCPQAQRRFDIGPGAANVSRRRRACRDAPQPSGPAGRRDTSRVPATARDPCAPVTAHPSRPPLSRASSAARFLVHVPPLQQRRLHLLQRQRAQPDELAARQDRGQYLVVRVGGEQQDHLGRRFLQRFQ